MNEQILVTPATDIQVVFAANGDRVFTVRFAPLPLDMARKDLDASLDLVLGAIERQRAKYELEDEEFKLAQQIDRLRKYEAQMLSITEHSKNWWAAAEGRRGEWTPDKLSPAQKNAHDQISVSLQNERHDADARQKQIERLRERVNATDVGADCNTGDAPG